MTDRYAVDAAFYDAIHDEFDDDTGLWLAYAGQTDARLLVVGCGTGRIAAPLAAAGSRVVGIDPSAAMLERARERAAREGVTVDWRPCGLLDAGLEPGTFGLVLIPADVFLYCEGLDEQLAWLAAAREALAFNGRLVLDLPGPALWLDPASNGQPLLVFRGETEDGQPFEAWHVHDDDLAAQTRWLQVTYERTGPDGLVRRLRSEHTLRYLYPQELRHLLARAGFEVVDLYGDYAAGVLSNDSDRMIAIAERSTG
jgi:SAM-dependent methyltransferase